MFDGVVLNPPLVTPQIGLNTVVTTSGEAVIAIPPGARGGYIINPLMPNDQGLSSPPGPEDLFVNQVGTPTLEGNGSTVRLQPGQSMDIIPFTTSAVLVTAATSGHKFTAVFW